MNDSRTIIWVLVAGLAVLSAGFLYLLVREDGAQAPPTQQIAAPAQPAAPPARFTRAAVTADPNGFSNVRGGPSIEHPVVGRIEQGETFTTYPQTGEWWEVRTAEGTTGYMASEWIRLQGGNAAAAPAPAVAAPVADADKPVAVAAVPANAVPPARRPRAADMLFPDSDRRLLSPSELSGLSLSELRVARNEIYARRGRAFADPSLRRYFSQYDWYRPVAAEVPLNRVESANVALLQRFEGR